MYALLKSNKLSKILFAELANQTTLYILTSALNAAVQFKIYSLIIPFLSNRFGAFQLIDTFNKPSDVLSSVDVFRSVTCPGATKYGYTVVMGTTKMVQAYKAPQCSQCIMWASIKIFINVPTLTCWQSGKRSIYVGWYNAIVCVYFHIHCVIPVLLKLRCI